MTDRGEWSHSGAAGRASCPDNAESAQHALMLASTITACYSLMMYVVNHVLPFFATAAAGATTYPDDVLCGTGAIPPPPGATRPPGWCDRLARSSQSWTWHGSRTPPTDAQVATLGEQATDLLRLAATSKTPYVVPMTLREHWEFIRQIGAVVKRLRDTEGLRPAESWYTRMI